MTSDISKWFDRKLWKSDAAAAVDGPVDVLSPMQGAVGLRQMITRFLRNKKISDKIHIGFKIPELEIFIIRITSNSFYGILGWVAY